MANDWDREMEEMFQEAEKLFGFLGLAYPTSPFGTELDRGEDNESDHDEMERLTQLTDGFEQKADLCWKYRGIAGRFLNEMCMSYIWKSGDPQHAGIVAKKKVEYGKLASKIDDCHRLISSLSVDEKEILFDEIGAESSLDFPQSLMALEHLSTALKGAAIHKILDLYVGRKPLPIIPYADDETDDERFNTDSIYDSLYRKIVAELDSELHEQKKRGRPKNRADRLVLELAEFYQNWTKKKFKYDRLKDEGGQHVPLTDGHSFVWCVIRYMNLWLSDAYKVSSSKVATGCERAVKQLGTRTNLSTP